MLEIRSLTFTYKQKFILRNACMKIQKDEIAVISGKSGSGKTTLLLCILGILNPHKGKIFLNQKEITHSSLAERQIAYVPQDYGLFPHLSVQENIAFGLHARNEKQIRIEKKVREVLRLVHLPRSYLFRNVNDLSGGEKQRVALARALAIQPRLFLLDEPLSAIDAETKQSVLKQLRALLKQLQIPVIIVIHDAEEAKKLGDAFYLLKDGKLLRK